MTTNEAIQAVKEVTGMSLPWNDRHYEALQMALSVLEKQIPMKTLPYEMGLDGKIEIPCGNCGSSLDGIWDYCPFCGQKILWRAIDDTGRSD